MQKKTIISILIIFVITIIGIFLLTTGGKRTDVYLKNFKISSDGKTMTLNVGVSSSSGYIRKIKRTSGSMNYYFTFYSTFGINSKIGSKDSFKIELDQDVDEIYFSTGEKGYSLVLQKNKETGKWFIPVDNKLKNYDFVVNIDKDSKHKKELAFTHNEKKFYYGNTKFELFLKNINNNKYSLETIIKNDIIPFDDILNKTDTVDILWDGGSKIYHYNNFNIIVCNTLAQNKDIIIGDNKITADEFCK